MKALGMFSVVALLCAVTVFAEEPAATKTASVKSGPQVGEDVGPFTVTKVAGAPEDGVKSGTELCYRCKLGARPVVMVFARKVDANLVKLSSELDTIVGQNTEKKMGSFVNLLGESSDGLTKDAEKLATDAKLKNVAVVVPNAYKTGPESYSINDSAEVTVLIYRNSKVKVNYALAAGSLNDEAIKKILADTKEILN